jgi:D-aminoacyl-tRNA deacylase
MEFAILVSKTDPAGMNIKEHLLKNNFKESGEFQENKVYSLDNIKIYTLNKESIYNENIDKEIKADLFIFATTHSATSKINSLSAHAPGNWNKAELGGQEKKLCIAPASYLKLALIELEKAKIEFEKIQECTHHGPYLEKPVMFIEIGSSLEQWQNKQAGEIIAKTIMKILTTEIPKYKIAFGIGGPHHTPNFKKIILNSDIAIGHVCPKYMLEFLDKEIIKQAIEKTYPKAELVLIDWKGLGPYKQKIKEMLEELKVPYKKTKEI